VDGKEKFQFDYFSLDCKCFSTNDINPQKYVDIYNADESDFQKSIHRVFIGGTFQSKINVNVLLQ
jgi:hypothetical protein